ncbi:MAG: GPI inositol-deacylase [Gammaproteobacteria bacterium]|nr:GPI inositol-deacylase [Gammaproteobacteria bacterium]MBT8094067.1 GPI inositol-deacylase [Gammaproteobacteria bacterium]MBT8105726.1 GPI inositol-deacylase [Gammaproteobacteria bacterium]NNK25740.1 alpha/beta hydrolase [Woeseiaceae bacterium]NNL63147.1 alpha/beta hydrolase [Woeseiaceae bacterium]
MVVDAAEATTGVVEKMHRTIQAHPGPMGAPAPDRTRGITGLVYRNIRTGIRLVGRAIDVSLAPLAVLLPEGKSSPARDAYRSAVNGVCGDYLFRTGNPLAIDMSLRFRGRPVNLGDPMSMIEQHSDVAPAPRKLLVLVHGLCANDRHWNRDGHDHGAALAEELGYLPLYLRYNSGMQISSNGQAFAELLERMISSWTLPPEQLVIMGHSMGGLVARSACHHGRAAGHAWLKHLGKLVFLGTPHHGAPLERGGHGLEFLMDLSPYSMPLARISKARSAGITDLRQGTVSAAQHDVPLPSGVECYALAAVRAAERTILSERLIGDGLVPLDSALGQHRDTARKLAIPENRQWIGYGMGHGDLLSRADVYARIRGWLRQSA